MAAIASKYIISILLFLFITQDAFSTTKSQWEGLGDTATGKRVQNVESGFNSLKFAFFPAIYDLLLEGSQSFKPSEKITLIGTILPWHSNAFEETMSNLNIVSGTNTGEYQSFSSSEFSSVDLNQTNQLIIIPSDQDAFFYSQLSQNLADLLSFVSRGGNMFINTASGGQRMLDAGITDIAGVSLNALYSGTNTNEQLESNIMADVPAEFSGSFASHYGFTNILNDATVYAKDQALLPSLILFNHGSGTIILSGLALEDAFKKESDARPIYQNIINYFLGRD